MSQENVELTRGLIEAFNRADWEAALKDVTRDFRCDFSRANGPLRGVHSADQWRQFLDDWSQGWQHIQIDAHEFIEVGEHVVVPWTMRGTGREGIEVVARTCWAFKIHDGRLAAITYFETKSEALDAVGFPD